MTELKAWRHYHYLNTLNLDGTEITDEALRHLRSMSTLRTLSVLRTDVTEEGIKQLRRALPGCTIHGPN